MALQTQDTQRLHALLRDRAEVVSQIDILNAEVAQIEATIAQIIATVDGSVRLPGFGSLCITAPSLSYGFAPDALRDLMQSLKETGHGDIAAEIAACKKPSYRAGGLRITPERARPQHRA